MTALIFECVISTTLLAAGFTPADEAPLALVGGTVHVDPETEPIRGGVILLKGDRIVAVGPRDQVDLPPESRTLDCAGLHVAAGFWNCHVHFLERKWARAAELPAAELEQQLGIMCRDTVSRASLICHRIWRTQRRSAPASTPAKCADRAFAPPDQG